MKDQLKEVNQFHKKFNVGDAPGSPTLIEKKEYLLRYNLTVEENREYLDACLQGNLVEVADALGDKLYILLGTILKHGMQDKIIDVFNEIHASNMSKLDSNGNPIFREDGKILKGENYFKPNLKQFIDEQPKQSI
jgi:predicted HAD superfamily Cof-like phosphohydrolase